MAARGFYKMQKSILLWNPCFLVIAAFALGCLTWCSFLKMTTFHTQLLCASFATALFGIVVVETSNQSYNSFRFWLRYWLEPLILHWLLIDPSIPKIVIWGSAKPELPTTNQVRLKILEKIAPSFEHAAVRCYWLRPSFGNFQGVPHSQSGNKAGLEKARATLAGRNVLGTYRGHLTRKAEVKAVERRTFLEEAQDGATFPSIEEL